MALWCSGKHARLSICASVGSNPTRVTTYLGVDTMSPGMFDGMGKALIGCAVTLVIVALAIGIVIGLLL